MDYQTLATDESVEKTIAALKERNIEALRLKDGAAALAKIKELIPQGASVMNGASVTLEEIGFVEYLQAGAHGWNNLHANILAEQDPAKQAELRRESVLSDYYLGSVHALAETGELVIASNTGSQLPHIVYTSPHIIFVAGTHKMVANLDSAMRRLYDYVIPREEVHMQEKYKVHTYPSKIVVVNREFPQSGRTVQLLLVDQVLGF